MFVNCKHCNALVATDPATDLPPERCPRCAGVLRRVASPAPAAAEPPAATQEAAPAAAEPAPPADAPETRETTPASAETTAVVAGDAPPDPAGTEPMPAPAAPEPRPDHAPGAIAAAPVFVPLRPAEDAAPAVDPDPDVPVASSEAPDAASLPAKASADEAPGDARASVETPIEIPVEIPIDTPVEAPPEAPSASTDAAGLAPDTHAHAVTARNAATPGVAAAPAFVARAAPATPPATGARRWALPSAVAALALLLGVQIVVADRERLARDARWRPLVASICGLLGCDLAPWRQPAAFVLLSRDVRPHPQVRGALRVRASFRNDAPWPQAWPRVLLTLSDVDGRTVGARAFDAREYRAGSNDGALLSPGQAADIALDILEPSSPSVSYAFEFH